jgi:hypothetical protein
MWGVIPRHNKNRRSGEGKSRPDTLPTRARIAVKGHLARTPIRAQEGNQRLQRWQARGNLPWPEPTGRSRFRHRPALQTSMTCCRLPCEPCSGEMQPISLRIHLDLLQRLAGLIGVGRLFGMRHQATRDVQDRARSFDWNGAEGPALLAAPGHEEDSRAEPQGQAPASNSLAAQSASLQSAG